MQEVSHRRALAETGLFALRFFLIVWPIMLLIALVACATPAPPEPIVRTVEVRVPYDDPACIRAAQERLGPSPNYPDTDQALAAAETVFRGVQLLQAGRVLRIAREAALTAAIAACGGR